MVKKYSNPSCLYSPKTNNICWKAANAAVAKEAKIEMSMRSKEMVIKTTAARYAFDQGAIATTGPQV